MMFCRILCDTHMYQSMCLPFFMYFNEYFPPSLFSFFLAILCITLILSLFIPWFYMLSFILPVDQYFLYNWCFLLGVRHLSRVRHTDTSLLFTSLKDIPSNSRRRLKKTSSNLLLSSSLPLPLSRYRPLHFDEDGYDIPFDSSRVTVNSADCSLERERDRSGPFYRVPRVPVLGTHPWCPSMKSKRRANIQA